jgi:hypothetical protein
MNRTLATLVALGLLLGAVGCMTTETEQLACPGADDTATSEDTAEPEDTSEPDDTSEPEDTSEPDDAAIDGETPEGYGQAVEGGAGSACEGPADCTNMGNAAGLCLTSALAKVMFGYDVDIPNGMCAAYQSCSTTGEPEEECGPGGHCFDAATVVGGEPGNETLCAHPCVGDFDCREAEAYACYFTGQPDEVRVCLPEAVIAIIPCGNGACEPEELETTETCPRDCSE